MAGSCLEKQKQGQPLLLAAQVRFRPLAPERFWIPLELRFALPTVAPGQTPGALRFVSLALHILPQKGGRHRRNVSARKVSEVTNFIRKRISLRL
jgi:hypothetical protein